MASEHDLELVTRIGAGTATGVVVADDPDEVAEAVSTLPGAVRTDVDVLACAIAGARVRLAEVVLERAREAAVDVAACVGGAAPPPDAVARLADGRDADRQAVRFASVVLLLALLGGIAVHLADDMVLAIAVPAVALVALGVVVLLHRGADAAWVAEEPTVPGPASEGVGIDADDTPAVRAAEAHLRRQQAAWKLAWWQRGEPVPDLRAWSPGLDAATPVTLVAVDRAGGLDPSAGATMTATAPAAVRVVVLQRRG